MAAGDVVPVQESDFVASWIWRDRPMAWKVVAHLGRIFSEAGAAGRGARAGGLRWLNPPTAEQAIPLLPAADQLDGLGVARCALDIAVLHFLCKEPPIKGGAAGIKTT